MWKLWKVRLVNRGPNREEETRTIPTKKDKDEAGKEACEDDHKQVTAQLLDLRAQQQAQRQSSPAPERARSAGTFPHPLDLVQQHAQLFSTLLSGDPTTTATAMQGLLVLMQQTQQVKSPDQSQGSQGAPMGIVTPVGQGPVQRPFLYPSPESTWQQDPGAQHHMLSKPPQSRRTQWPLDTPVPGEQDEVMPSPDLAAGLQQRHREAQEQAVPPTARTSSGLQAAHLKPKRDARSMTAFKARGTRAHGHSESDYMDGQSQENAAP